MLVFTDLLKDSLREFMTIKCRLSNFYCDNSVIGIKKMIFY